MHRKPIPYLDELFHWVGLSPAMRYTGHIRLIEDSDYVIMGIVFALRIDYSRF